MAQNTTKIANEGGDRGLDPIHGEGIGTPTDCGKCGGFRRN